MSARRAGRRGRRCRRLAVSGGPPGSIVDLAAQAGPRPGAGPAASFGEAGVEAVPAERQAVGGEQLAGWVTSRRDGQAVDDGGAVMLRRVQAGVDGFTSTSTSRLAWMARRRAWA